MKRFQFHRGELFQQFYSPREFVVIVGLNLWVFVQGMLIGNPGLDPDQQRGIYQLTKRDEFTWAVFPVIFIFFYVTGYWPFLVWFLSPAFVCATAELVPPGKYRGPRVWLPRWYVATLGVVMMFSGFPAWFRWLIVIVWGIQALHVASFYSSELKFYEELKRENPNRHHFKLGALPYLYFREGQHWKAEEEIEEVLTIDPTNEKAGLLKELVRRNREWIAAGFIGVGFRCEGCGEAFRLLKDGDRLTRQEHDMFFLRICPVCRHTPA